MQSISGESPLTLRPNFNCEKGSVTAAAAACMPRRGSFVDENLLYDLRVILESYSTGKMRTLFFFLFLPGIQRRIISNCVNAQKPVFVSTQCLHTSKEKKKRNSL